VAALSEKHLTERTETMDESANQVTVNLGPLYEALAKAQAEFEPILRTREVEVATKTGGRYKFTYAPLENVLEATVKALAKHGLTLHHEIRPGLLVTRLGHSSGAAITSSTPLPDPAVVGWHQYGSSVTYARRYHDSAMLGVASEPDDDANEAEGNRVVAAHDKKPAKKQDDSQVNPLDELAGAIEDLIGSPKAADKLTWCSDMLKRPIAKPTDMTAEEVTKLLAAAKAGQMPGGPR
jgi:hypothetical protein